MKRLVNVCILVLICISLLVVPGCKKVPVYTLANLAVTPEKPVGGEMATISVDVNNLGKGQGLYVATCKIDDILVGSQNMTIMPAAGQKFTFNAIIKEPGAHVVTVDNVSIGIVVLKPAQFKLTDLKLSSGSVVSGESANVTVNVANIGEVKGDYNVILKVKGSESETKKVSLDGGAAQTMSFTVSTKEPGAYSVAVGDLNDSLKALKPAEFKVSAPRVSPAQVVAGWSSTVTADVTNIGEVRGDYQVTLTIGGKEIQSKTVSINGGATDTVSFIITQDEGGDYNLSVNGQNGTLTVKQGVLPKLVVGDKWVYRLTDSGTMYTYTETVTGEEILDGKDCYIVKTTYDPYSGGWVPGMTEWWEKSSCYTLKWQFSAQATSGTFVNRTWTYTRTLTGSEYPHVVGSSYTYSYKIDKVDVVLGTKYPTTVNYGPYTIKCEKIETIKVNAGEFRTFKMVCYDATGKMLNEAWYSDKAKAVIKVTFSGSSNSQELLSYSVKDGGL
jgi:hypothetical protein